MSEDHSEYQNEHQIAPETPIDPVVLKESWEATKEIPFGLFPTRLSKNDISTIIEFIEQNKKDLSKEDLSDLSNAITTYINMSYGDGVDSHRVGALNKGFTQGFNYQGTSTKIKSKKIKKPEGGKTYSSRSDVRSILSSINNTSTSRDTVIPLYNSRMTVVIGDITKEDMLYLLSSINEANLAYVKLTGGLSLSPDESIAIDHILRLVLKKIKASTLRNPKDYELKEAIKITDLQSLLAGVLQSLYPNRYPVYHFDMGVHDDKCKFDFEALRQAQEDLDLRDKDKYAYRASISFGDLPICDVNRLTDEDIKYIRAELGTIELKDLLKYQKEQERKLSQEFYGPLQDDSDALIYVKFKVPSIKEYLESCNEWHQEIQSEANRLLSTANYSDLSARTVEEKEIIKSAKEETLAGLQENVAIRMQLSKLNHWLSEFKFVIDGEESFVTGSSATKEVIDEFHQNKDFAFNLVKSYHKFRANNNLVITGYWDSPCPSCDSKQGPGDEHPNLIPVNMVSFFVFMIALVSRQINRVSYAIEDL